MRVNTSMTKKKATESSYGLMVANMMVSGRMESSTEEAPTFLAKAKPKPASGKRESVFSGLKKLPDKTTSQTTKETIENESD
jgi:hypothetical protein